MCSIKYFQNIVRFRLRLSICRPLSPITSSPLFLRCTAMDVWPLISEALAHRKCVSVPLAVKRWSVAADSSKREIFRPEPVSRRCRNDDLKSSSCLDRCTNKQSNIATALMIDIIHLKKNIIGQLIMHNIIALKYHVGVIFNDISSCPASLTPFYMGQWV